MHYAEIGMEHVLIQVGFLVQIRSRVRYKLSSASQQAEALGQNGKIKGFRSELCRDSGIGAIMSSSLIRSVG